MKDEQPFRLPSSSRETHLDGKISSVDIISQKQVSSVLRVSTNLKELHKVELKEEEEEKQSLDIGLFSYTGVHDHTHVLAMDISTNCNQKEVVC